MPGRVSVVIPTLDEEDWIDGCLQTLADADEIVVADGGSSDATRELARARGARVVVSRPGRGVQSRAGAELVTGEWLLLLHADTRLAPGWRQELDGVGEPFVGGAFRLTLDAPGRFYRWFEAGVAWRCRTWHLPYAHQGLFVRRRVHDQVGGIAPLPTLEDIDLIQRVGRMGPLAWLDTAAITSARRFQAAGLLRPAIRNWLCLLFCVLRVPPRRVAGLFADRWWGASGRGR